MKNNMTVFMSIVGPILLMSFALKTANSEIAIRSIPLTPSTEKTTSRTEGTATPLQDTAQQEQDKEKEAVQKKSYLERAQDALRRAKDKGNSQADAAQKWLNNRIQDATASTTDAAQDTGVWANQTYQMLKEQGLTTAGSVGEWLSDDIRNMDSWQYKVIRMNMLGNGFESDLNKLGAQGWELVSSSPQAGSTEHVLVFKKSNHSYLRSVPLKDLLPLIPLMGGETGK